MNLDCSYKAKPKRPAILVRKVRWWEQGHWSPPLSQRDYFCLAAAAGEGTVPIFDDF